MSTAALALRKCSVQIWSAAVTFKASHNWYSQRRLPNEVMPLICCRSCNTRPSCLLKVMRLPSTVSKCVSDGCPLACHQDLSQSNACMQLTVFCTYRGTGALQPWRSARSHHECHPWGRGAIVLLPCRVLSYTNCSTFDSYDQIREMSPVAHRETGCRLAWQMPRCGTGRVVVSLADMQPSIKVLTVFSSCCGPHAYKQFCFYVQILRLLTEVCVNVHNKCSCCRACDGGEGERDSPERSAKHFCKTVCIIVHSLRGPNLWLGHECAMFLWALHPGHAVGRPL